MNLMEEFRSYGSIHSFWKDVDIISAPFFWLPSLEAWLSGDRQNVVVKWCMVYVNRRGRNNVTTDVEAQKPYGPIPYTAFNLTGCQSLRCLRPPAVTAVPLFQYGFCWRTPKKSWLLRLHVTVVQELQILYSRYLFHLGYWNNICFQYLDTTVYYLIYSY